MRFKYYCYHYINVTIYYLRENIRKYDLANSPISRNSAIVTWQEIWSDKISSM